MADSKQDEGFKVVDRRLFTEEGELRKEVVEQERLEEEASSKKAPPAPKAQASGPKVPGSTGLADEFESAASAEKEEEIPPSRNFQMLVDFLTRNAAAMLGGMADPRTGQAFLDLEGAREMIDMLDVLREKTKGNLAKVDEDLLIEIAGSLKLTYLEMSKAASEQLKKQAGINMKK